jgi:hypothetical protein
VSKKRTTFVSIDVETTGAIPGTHGLMSIGAAAFKEPLDDDPVVLEPFSTFRTNVDVKGFAWDPSTKEWWLSQDPDVMAAQLLNPAQVVDASNAFADWAVQLPQPRVVAVWPAWDYAWVLWLLGQSGRFPFGATTATLGMKSLAFGLRRDLRFKECVKRNFDPAWFDGAPMHNHDCLQDAIGQGVMLMHMLATRRDAT